MINTPSLVVELRITASCLPSLENVTAANLSIDILRKKKREGPFEDESKEEENPAPHTSFPLVQLGREEAMLIRQLLDRLPSIDRIVLEMRYGEQLSYQEISQALNFTVPAVAQRIRRGKEALRREFESGKRREMNCQEINPKLYLYADGELAAEEKRAVEAHLKECAACRMLLSALEQENELLGVITSAPSWDFERLEQLEKRLLQTVEPGRPTLWQEFLGFLADAVWLGILVILLCIFMVAIRFNGGVLYELAGAPSVVAANKSLIPAQLFISGLMLLFVLFKYWQFHSLSKKSI